MGKGGMCTVTGLGGMTRKRHLVGGGLEEVKLGCGSTRDKLRERKERLSSQVSNHPKKQMYSSMNFPFFFFLTACLQ